MRNLPPHRTGPYISSYMQLTSILCLFVCLQLTVFSIDSTVRMIQYDMYILNTVSCKFSILSCTVYFINSVFRTDGQEK